MEGEEKNGEKLKIDSISKEKKSNSKNMRKFWNSFRIISPNTAIIQGSFAINDKRFKLGSRGLQSVTCSITAIVFDYLFNPEDWNKDIVDRVLIYGDKIFRISRTKNRLHKDALMTSSLVYPEFFIDDYKCNICARESIINGYIFTENNNCPNLRKGIEIFFMSFKSGVLTTQGISVAIWQNINGEFFYFNSTNCDDNGLKCFDGVACIIRFKCFNDILDFILNTLDKKCNSKYFIDGINITNIIEIRRRNFHIPQQNTITNKSKNKCINSDNEKQRNLKIRRVPVIVTNSIINIAENFEKKLSETQNISDTNYTFSDVRVNFPSTFKQLSNDLWILHGWTHENSEIYKGKGAQNVLNCLMSIGMRKINPVKTWLRLTLDEILNLGDIYYTKFKIDKPNIKELTAIDLNDTKFQINNNNMIANVDILTIIGMLSSRTTSVLNLKSAMEEFFLNNQTGIIETPIMAVAIWMENEYYYMFDPRQCDANGYRIVEEKKKKENTKKDNLTGKEKKINGKCCVIQFSNINLLTEHFIQNIPLGMKNDRFLIRNINIIDDIPGTQPWYNFEPGEIVKTWILRGNIINDSKILSNKNYTMAISIVTLAFAKNYPPFEWTKQIIDNIINEGNEYYNWCFSSDSEDIPFDLLNFKNILYINNRKVNLELKEAVVVGNIIINDDNRLMKYEKGINQFFENYQYGIFEINDINFAIWKEIDSKDPSNIMYYLFILNQKNQNLEEEKESVSCLMRILNITDMAKIIDKNIDYKTENNLQYLIHNVNLPQLGNLMTIEEIENDKKSILKPELQQYSSINDEKACLNGSINQGNELIFSNETRNKQQAGNSILTLAMTKIHNPHLWTKQVIDDILRMGDKITNENINNLSSSEEETRNWLLPNEIGNEFNVGVNNIRFELQDNVINGNLNNLTKILEEFFTDKNMGIFKSNNTIMPIWKQGSVFFTMDPNGRDSQGIPKEKDGTSAVLWFTNISALASDLNSTIGNNTNADFSIDNIIIENNYETKITDQEKNKDKLSNMWYNFSKQSDNIWFINGNIEFNNEKFNEKNQTAAIAIMTIVFSKIYNPQRWSKEVIDEVIITGDKLHSNCEVRCENNKIPKVNDIMNEFFLSDRRINLSINDCVQSGGFNNISPKIQDILTGINKFFSDYTSGILIINGEINLAIWKFDDFYYYFSPISRLMRFGKITDLVNQIIDDYNVEDYEIVSIDIINWNKMPPWTFDPSPKICPSMLPPLNAYKRLEGGARALLLGSSYQGSEIFSENIRNHQAAANCIIALGTSIVKSPDTWTRNTLDEILSLGNSLHQESLKSWPEKIRLRPENIIRIFHLGHNILSVDVSIPIISGQVSIPPPEPETKEKKKKTKQKPDRKKKKGKVKRGPATPPPAILLEEGIRKFFENNNSGVLIIGHSVIAIWKQLGVYFMYVSDKWKDENLKNNSSYTAWFACIEPFYNLIYNNLDDSEKYTTYEICKVLFRTNTINSLPYSTDLNICELSTASNVSTKIENITFSGIRTLNTYSFSHEEVSILYGTRNMNDVIFDKKNRGLQSTAIAVVAIVVGSIHVPSTWTPQIIDAILTYGDLLHLDSCRLLEIYSRNLSPCELHTVFIVGDCRAHINVHQSTMTGLLYPYDVEESLRFFFKNNTCGILHTSNVAMAVTQHYGKFYLFNPCYQSGKSNSDVPAHIMKFSNLNSLAKTFVTNCNSNKPNVYTLNAVNVLSLYFFSNLKKSDFVEC